MVHRVTTSSINAELVRNMQQSYNKYADLTTKISSGKKINSIIDNPSEAIDIIDTKRELNRIDVWQDNISTLANELNQSMDSIDIVIEKVQRVKDLATSAANETFSEERLNSILEEVDTLIESIVSSANTKYKGNYIFSGTNTQTPPYEVQYDKNNNIIGIKYNGTMPDGEWERQLEISEGVFQTGNVTGFEVFGDADAEGHPTGIMGELIDFKNTLEDIVNNNGKTHTDITNLLDNFTHSINQISGINSRLGTINNKLEMFSNSLNSTKLNLKEFLSGAEDIDMTEAITEWYSSQYAYQASMQVFTKFNSMSILNYI